MPDYVEHLQFDVSFFLIGTVLFNWYDLANRFQILGLRN